MSPQQQRAQQTTQRRRRLRKQHQGQKQLALDAPLAELHPNQVLTFLEWCRLNRISERNGRRILQGDDPPDVVQLSVHRIGITVAANKAWQARRTRGVAG